MPCLCVMMGITSTWQRLSAIRCLHAKLQRSLYAEGSTKGRTAFTRFNLGHARIFAVASQQRLPSISAFHGRLHVPCAKTPRKARLGPDSSQLLRARAPVDETHAPQMVCIASASMCPRTKTMRTLGCFNIGSCLLEWVSTRYALVGCFGTSGNQAN